MTLAEKIEACTRDANGCWLWPGHRDKDGYCQVGVDGVRYRAHRAVYERLVGAIPDELTLDHLCRVTNCVNPAHLEPVPIEINLQRGSSPSALNRSVTHCPAGHPYDDGNTYRNDKGRSCRECSRQRHREWSRRRTLRNRQEQPS